jgi:limonene-1,2-epoxide hydrolase
VQYLAGNPKTRQIVEEFAYSQDPKYFSKNAVFVVEPLSESFRGRQAIRTMFDEFFHKSFDRTSVEIVNVAADSVSGLGFIEFIFRGRHTQTFGGIKPTGKDVQIPMLGVYEIDETQIKSARLYYDAKSISGEVE